MTARDSQITIIGCARYRTGRRPFGVKGADRFSHLYAIGKTGTGKSTLLEYMALQDLHAGRGFCLIDPHGDLVSRLNEAVPPWRRGTVIYLDAGDPTQPYGYNPLRPVSADRVALAASGFLEVLKNVWSNAWGVRIEHLLRNGLHALLERPDSTLADIMPLLRDEEFRQDVAATLKNDAIRRFWADEYAQFSRAYRADTAAAVENKIGAFLADPILRRLLTTPERPISIRRVMDQGQVLLVNLSKGRLGDDTARLLGGLLVTTVGLAGLSRADMPPEDRRPFFLYIDEFQAFTTPAVAGMLSELRKYRVGLTMAHQYLGQLDPEIRHAVLGNAGTLIAFRVGGEDAPYLAREFQGRIAPNDLINLANHEIYLKLMIDGQPSRVFSASTVPPTRTPPMQAA